GGPRRVRADALVAVESRHFLDQIFLDREVVAVARRLHHEGVGVTLRRQREALEAPLHLLRRHLHADDLLRARDAHAHRLPLGQLRNQIFGRPRLPAADVQDEARGALDAIDVVVEIDAALEAVPGIAAEAIAARAAHDRVGPEERRLEKQVARAAIGLRRLSAHDAAEADDAAL